jgi:hypothetical protein
MDKWENCTQVLIDLMKDEGYDLVAVNDGEEWHYKDFIENATSTDESTLKFKSHNDIIVYYMVWGNATYESICDYTVSEVADRVSDKFWNYFEEKANLYN